MTGPQTTPSRPSLAVRLTTFDTVSHLVVSVITFLVGFALLMFFALLLYYEVRTPPSHNLHIAIFAGGMVVGLILMGFAKPLASGIQTVGAACADYLPWKRV